MVQLAGGETVFVARAPAEDVLRSPYAPHDAWRADIDEPAETSRVVKSVAETTERVRRFGRSFDERAAVYGALGFICGMIVWHVVGFWSFMSNVVLNSPDASSSRPQALAQSEVARRSTAAASDTQAGAITTGSISSAPVAKARDVSRADLCLALQLDRASGTTRTAPCPDDAHTFRDAGFQRRADQVATTPRLENATAWATGTALSSNAAATDASMSESDFSLEIRTEP